MGKPMPTTQPAAPRFWTRIPATTATLAVRTGRVLWAETRRIIDLEQWSNAQSWRARLSAVSWPRAGACAVIALVVGAAIFTLIPRQGAYRHPDPTAREIRLRQTAIENAPHEIPVGLREANRSVETGR